MRDFPSCFGENGVQVADASCSSSSVVGVGVVGGGGGVSNSNSSKASQNLVTCLYKCKLLGKSCLITIIWSKNLMGHCLSLEINDLSHQCCLCKVDVKPSLFFKRKGSKNFEVMNNSAKVDIFWDLSVAKFGSGGPEPLEGYYLAVVCKGEIVLVIGDLRKEAFKKTNATLSLSSTPLFISKREHLFGKRVFGTKVQFSDNGQIHDLKIEYDTNGGNEDPCLIIRIDSKPVMQVKHLRWKFRGNYTILVDGIPVEVFWDVYDWLFSSSSSTCLGNAVFMFQTCLSAEKLCTSQTLSDLSFLPWPSSGSFGDSKVSGLGFSLMLYVWKNE